MKTKLDVDYVCPFCRSYLRVWNNIIFSVKSCTDDKKGLLLLNPELGNYEFISHHSLEFKEMDCLDFYCPVCFEDLKASEVNKNLARIVMIDKEEQEFDVSFSRIRNEHSTFKVSNDQIIEKHGKDSSSYLDYFMSKLKKEKNKTKD